MTTLTHEQRMEIEKAGDAPVHLEDPETHQQYVLLRADVYAMLREAAEDEASPIVPQLAPEDVSGRVGEDPVRTMYPLIDRTFRDGWERPEMAEYDDYEKYRP